MFGVPNSLKRPEMLNPRLFFYAGKLFFGKKCRKKGYFVALYSSINQAAKAVGRGRKDIFCAISGRQKTCAGYVWEFASEEEKQILSK